MRSYHVRAGSGLTNNSALAEQGHRLRDGERLRPVPVRFIWELLRETAEAGLPAARDGAD